MSQQSNLQDFHIVDGVLLHYRGHDACVRVPDGVTRIGEGAFTQVVQMAGAGGPPPMISWGGLENPHLFDETHDESIGFAFLRTVYLPDTVEVIEKNAFSRCYHLESVRFPRNLRRICRGAFTNCFDLSHIELPGSVVVEPGAFNLKKHQIIFMPNG